MSGFTYPVFSLDFLSLHLQCVGHEMRNNETETQLHRFYQRHTRRLARLRLSLDASLLVVRGVPGLSLAAIRN